MGRSTLTVFVDAVLGAGVETGGGAGGPATGGEGFSWCKAFSRSAVSRSSRLGRSPKLRLDHGEDRAKIGGTGVDIRGMGSSVLRHLCEKKKKANEEKKKNVR